MPDQTSNSMQCQEFDALLADAVDGVLTGTRLQAFEAHSQSCPSCKPLAARVQAGRQWLKSLAEVEPPAHLVSSILASTTGVDTQRLRAVVPAGLTRESYGHSWFDQARGWLDSVASPVWGVVRQPRFAMSFAMVFFAASLGLSVVGVKPADLREVSLRPSAIRHAYYSTSGRVVKYYENIRLVYEVESRLREFKRAAPAEPGPATKKDKSNDTSKEPEQKQDRNYSQAGERLILAGVARGPSGLIPTGSDLPVVSVTTDRRFV
jgi:hypothetical protein